MAFARQCHQRDRQPLLIDLAPVGTHAEPADVDDMHRAGEEPDRLAAQKGRADDGQIVQMPASQPRVVGDVVVARAHRLEWKGVEKVPDRRRHRIHVTGGAGDRLRQHVAVAVEHSCREVAGLAHCRRKGGAHQRLRLLFDDGDQPAPHDLHVDLRQRGVGSAKHQLLLGMPNIVIRPTPLRNVGCRGRQSDRVRPKLFGCICSQSTASTARKSCNDSLSALKFCDGNAAILRAAFSHVGSRVSGPGQAERRCMTSRRSSASSIFCGGGQQMLRLALTQFNLGRRFGAVVHSLGHFHLPRAQKAVPCAAAPRPAHHSCA
jgi:hypothetical protein